MAFVNPPGPAITRLREVMNASLAMRDDTVLPATTPLVPAMALARAVSFALRDPPTPKVLVTAVPAIIAQLAQEAPRALGLARAALILAPAKAFARTALSVQPLSFMRRRWNTLDQSPL